MAPNHQDAGSDRHPLRLLAIATACFALGLGEVKAQQGAMHLPTATVATNAPTTIQSLTPDSTISDLLNHPDFRGFARHLLPWADRRYDDSLPLRQISRLLPYHSSVDPETVLSGLNRLVELNRQGVSVFHEIYSEEERVQKPDLDEAGLFFFPGKAGAPFALIAPGGGFSYVGSVHEGFPYAIALAELGFNAFVATYRTGQGGRAATQDMARAVDYIMANTDALKVASAGYSVWGSSAGARMAAYIGSHGPSAFGANTTKRPSTVVMAYTSHSDLGDIEPPTYAIVGERDGIAPPVNMQRRVKALQNLDTDVSFRIVPDIGHGFGAGTNTPAQGWIKEAAEFWQAHLPDTVLHPTTQTNPRGNRN